MILRESTPEAFAAAVRDCLSLRFCYQAHPRPYCKRDGTRSERLREIIRERLEQAWGPPSVPVALRRDWHMKRTLIVIGLDSADSVYSMPGSITGCCPICLFATAGRDLPSAGLICISPEQSLDRCVDWMWLDERMLEPLEVSIREPTSCATRARIIFVDRPFYCFGLPIAWRSSTYLRHAFPRMSAASGSSVGGTRSARTGGAKNPPDLLGWLCPKYGRHPAARARPRESLESGGGRLWKAHCSRALEGEPPSAGIS